MMDGGGRVNVLGDPGDQESHKEVENNEEKIPGNIQIK